MFFFSETAKLNHFILNMHISLHVGGLLIIVKMGRRCLGGSVHPPEKLKRICVIPLNVSNYIANSAIILYPVCLVCLSSHFEKIRSK